MRFVIYIVLFLIAGLGFAVSQAPVSYVLERAMGFVPGLQATGASGTVWSGRVENLRFGQQPIGDVSFKARMLALLKGAFETDIRLSDGTILGDARVRLSADQRLTVSDARFSGTTGELRGLIDEVRALNGRFTVDIAELVADREGCIRANGIVWTDLLSKLDRQLDWRGPALEGPMTCRNGALRIDMAGTGQTGEEVAVEMSVNFDGSGQFLMRIAGADNDLANAASFLGFVQDGTELVYSHEVTSGET